MKAKANKHSFTIGPFPICLAGRDITFNGVIHAKLIDLDAVADLKNPDFGYGVDISITCDTDPEWSAQGYISTAFDFRREELTSMALSFVPPLHSNYSIWPIYGLELDELPEVKVAICDVVKEMYYKLTNRRNTDSIQTDGAIVV